MYGKNGRHQYKTEGRTVIFVSHNMGAVQSLCNKGILLEKGNLLETGTIKETVNSYLKKIHNTKNIEYFENSILKEIELKQEKEKLLIKVKYKSSEFIKIPNFGFVIKNSMGTPITGSNPIKYGIKDFGLPKKEGKFKLVFYHHYLQMITIHYQFGLMMEMAICYLKKWIAYFLKFHKWAAILKKILIMREIQFLFAIGYLIK
jgi:lipopolysaccharide transport system ATP-binding protein